MSYLKAFLGQQPTEPPMRGAGLDTQPRYQYLSNFLSTFDSSVPQADPNEFLVAPAQAPVPIQTSPTAAQNAQRYGAPAWDAPSDNGSQAALANFQQQHLSGAYNLPGDKFIPPTSMAIGEAVYQGENEQFAQTEQVDRDKKAIKTLANYGWGQRMLMGVLSAGANRTAEIQRLTGNQAAADETYRRVGAIEQALGQIEQEEGRVLPDSVLTGISGATRSLIDAYSVSKFGTGAIIADAAISRSSEALTEAKDAGLSGRGQLAYAGTQGMIEGGITALFMRGDFGGLESAVVGKQIASQTMKQAAKKLGKGLAGEFAEEAYIAIGDAVTKKLMDVDPNSLDKDRLAEDLRQTAVSVAITMGTAHAISKFAESPTRKNYDNLPAEVKTIGPTPTEADRSRLAAELSAKQLQAPQPTSVPPADAGLTQSTPSTEGVQMPYAEPQTLPQATAPPQGQPPVQQAPVAPQGQAEAPAVQEPVDTLRKDAEKVIALEARIGALPEGPERSAAEGLRDRIISQRGPEIQPVIDGVMQERQKIDADAKAAAKSARRTPEYKAAVARGRIQKEIDAMNRRGVTEVAARKKGKKPIGDAVWKAPDGMDRPIVVSHVAGIRDGETYLAVTGSDTAVPLSQVEFAGDKKPELAEQTAEQPAFGPASVGAAQTRQGTLGDDQKDVLTSLQVVGVGRPDLQNPGTSSMSRAAIDEMDEARKAEFIKQSHKQWAAEAERRMQDPVGEAEKLLQRFANIEEFGGADEKVAQQLVDKAAKEAFSGEYDEAKMLRAKALHDAHRATRTDLARRLGSARDPVETPADRAKRVINDVLFRGSEQHREDVNEATEQLKTAKTEGNDADLAAAKLRLEHLQKQWNDSFKILKEKLEKAGYDLSDLDKIAEDPVEGQRMLTAVETLTEGTIGEVAYEYWRNAILSAGTTTGADVISSATYGTYKLFVERGAEALLNLKGKKTDAATFAEFSDILGGAAVGFRRGLQNAMMAWKTEQPQLQHQMGEDPTGKFGSLKKRIPGKAGRIIRAFGYTRLLLADEFTQTLVANMEVAAQARRLALGKGMEPGSREMNAFISNAVEDMESEAWQKAMDVARNVTFQQQGSKTTQLLKEKASVAQKLPGARYVIPFTQTPLNILETGLAVSPLGIFNLAYKWRRARITGNYKGITQKTAQQILAWGGVLLLMLTNDEDDPWITGSKDEEDYEGVKSRVAPPQSIKIRGQWYSYSRIEPLATGLSTSIDVMNAIKSGSPLRVVNDTLTSAYKNVTGKSYLKGLADVAGVFEHGPVEGIEKWASNFAASWVPNILRHAAKNTRDELPERRVWGANDEEFLMSALKRTAQKTEIPQTFGLLEDVPKYDVWGQPLKRNESPIPMTDYVFRMVAPTATKTSKPFIGDRVLMRWNTDHPDDEKNPSLPAKYFTVNGEKWYLSEDEYGDYLKLAGSIARESVLLLPLDPENPKASDIAAIESAFTSARRVAKEHLLKGKGELDTKQAAVDINKKRISALLYTMTDDPKPSVKGLKPEAAAAKLEERQQSIADASKLVGELSIKRDDAVKMLKSYWTERGFKVGSDAYYERLRRIPLDK